MKNHIGFVCSFFAVCNDDIIFKQFPSAGNSKFCENILTLAAPFCSFSSKSLMWDWRFSTKTIMFHCSLIVRFQLFQCQNLYEFYLKRNQTHIRKNTLQLKSKHCWPILVCVKHLELWLIYEERCLCDDESLPRKFQFSTRRGIVGHSSARLHFLRIFVRSPQTSWGHSSK